MTTAHRNIKIPHEPQAILADLYYGENSKNKLVVFCHGFKGFKDWGAWHLVAEAFAKAGFIFLKFNFSHNGVGQEDLQAFTRLDLFYENNYSKELEDLQTVLDWTSNAQELIAFQVNEVYLIGHSRGGGIALQAASRFAEISKLATWASISHFDRFGDVHTKATWHKEGYRNFYNSRTKQDMKIGIQFLLDYKANKEQLDLEKSAKHLDKPYLIVHGKNDDAVGFSSAQRLKKWCSSAKLHLIENANHVFGSKHPFDEDVLPKQLQEVVDETISFFASPS